jgi:hypothetical protein
MNVGGECSRTRCTRLFFGRTLVLTIAMAIGAGTGAVSAAPGFGDSNIFALNTISVSAVGQDPPAVLRDFVGPCTPNPFNPKTTVHFGVTTRGPAQLVIYDVRGRVVRVLVDEPDIAPGIHQAAWDGRDDQGRAVASGVYLAQLRAGLQIINATMTLVR